MQLRLKLERCKPHKAARHPRKCDVINDVKLFPTVDSISQGIFTGGNVVRGDQNVCKRSPYESVQI